jgi:hypothetical protein
MTDERSPEETPASSAEPAPLAPLVQQASEAPPPVTWAAPPPAAPAPAKGQRSMLSLIAGILLLVGGTLGGLAGLAIAVVGRSIIEAFGDLGTIPGLEGYDATAIASGIMTFVGVLILIYSLLYLVGGIGVIRSRDWGRVLGLAVGILSGLIWLGSFATPDQGSVRGSLTGSLIVFGIHAYIVVALLFFWRTKPAT